MKNRLYNNILIGILCSLISSCQPSADEEPMLPSEKIRITFTLAFDELSSASRAAWGENETEADASTGNEYENQIDLNSENGLQVFIYSTDGKVCLSEVTNKDVVRMEENGRTVYQFTGDALMDNNVIQDKRLNCRLMVFANCDRISTTTGTDGLYYQYDANAFATHTKFIPMWGVKQCELDLHQGDLSTVDGYIYLLRSMAKVEVKLDSSIAGELDLQNVVLSKYNVKGNVLPGGYANASATEAMQQESVFNPNNESTATDLAFTKVSDDEFHVYLPEYQNVGNGADAAMMTIWIEGEDYPLEFKIYDNDGYAENDVYFNIVRNHYYQYVITHVNTVENALVLYQSMPWNDVNNGSLDFGKGNGNARN